MIKEQILPPNPAILIEGLRDTGYEFNTALADIVDNSIDANATQVDIMIEMDGEGDILISVADNGCGMNNATLLNGMTYGADGNADNKRLGKFGLGLKTASTAFCRKLSVITRDSTESPLIKATWNLDHVVKMNEWKLILSESSDYENQLFNKTAENSSGTLVMWEQVDRLIKEYQDPSGRHARKALDKFINDFRLHASMIYQRFLDPIDTRARDINITVNSEPVPSWNPFCESESETELVAEKELPIEFNGKNLGSFHIRAFVLPRKEQFSSNKAAKESRLSNSMQGIYIYRENRLIHPSDWLGMFTKEPHFTLLRIEFSFNHSLDEAFQVDIKKSRILLNEELRDWLLNEFLPAPRNAANERYRSGRKKAINVKSKDAHDTSNRSISSHEKNLISSKVTILNQESGKVEVENKSGKVKYKLRVLDSSKPGQVCVLPIESINDGLLWAPALIDSHHAVQINTGHPYYGKVYVPNLNSNVAVQGMDALLWALSEAELGTINEETKGHFEDLRNEVSRVLRKLVEDLPEPDLEL